MRNFEKITRKSSKSFGENWNNRNSKTNKIKRKEQTKRNWVEII